MAADDSDGGSRWQMAATRVDGSDDGRDNGWIWWEPISTSEPVVPLCARTAGPDRVNPIRPTGVSQKAEIRQLK